MIQIPQNEAEIQEAYAEGMKETEIKEYFKSFVDELVAEIVLLEKLKGAQNIVGIDDYKVVEKEDKIGYTIYIRMELLTSINQYFKNQEIQEKEVVKLGVDLCKALECCEKLGIMHRDIKPENIFISKFGEYKLGDFGIARKLENTSSIMSKKGTYLYMAPEVYKGGKYGKTVDMYSLGLVMYKLCNQNRNVFLPEPPAKITYTDKENALSKRMEGAKFPRPTAMSSKLFSIVEKMCAYDSKKRYSSASEAKQALESLLNSGMYDKAAEALEEKTVGVFARTAKKQKEKESVIEDKKDIEKITKEETADFSNEGKVKVSKEETTNKEEANMQKHKKEADTPKKEKEKKKNTWKVVLLVLLCVIITIAGFLFTRNPNTEETIVELPKMPKVTGMQIADAEKTLKEIELEVQTEEIYRAEAADGEVVYQSIEENEVVEKGTKVVLLVNNVNKKEIEKIRMILVEGKTIEEARTTLAGLGLQVEELESNHDTIAENIVISQDIAEGTEIEKGSTIKLTVSLGKEEEEEETQQQEQQPQTQQGQSTTSTSQQTSSNEKPASSTTPPQTTQNNPSTSDSSQTKPSTSTSEQTNNKPAATWSNWVTALPSTVSSNKDKYNIETKTQYSYRTKQTTTSIDANLEGWTKDGIASTTYSDWSMNLTSTHKPEESELVRIISQSEPTTYTWYHWYSVQKGGSVTAVGPNSEQNDPNYVSSEKHTITTHEMLTDRGNNSYFSSSYKCSKCGMGWWWLESTSVSPIVYTYQQRRKIITYNYYKWGDWSSYSDTKVSANDNREVRQRTVYRYKAK